ncbi:MAG: polysaccharide biosynthesis tyrosine autokinase [Pseudomonadota bacterium]
MNKQSSFDLDYAGRLRNASAPAYIEDEVISPSKLFRALRRRIFVFSIVAFSVCLAMAVATFQMRPVYSAFASVIVDPSEQTAIDLGSMISGGPVDSSTVETQTEIIRSRSLAGKIVDQLNLVDNPEFNPDLSPPGAKTRIKNIFVGIANRFAPRQPVVASPDEATIAELQRNVAVDILMLQTSAHRVGATYRIDIHARSGDPKLSADIANAIVDQYLVEQLDAKFDQARRNGKWLENRLVDLRTEVNNTEAAVEAYRAEQGLFVAGDQTLNEQQIADINAQLVVQHAELAERRARLASVRQSISNGATAEISSEALNSNVIANLRNQQAEVVRKRAELESRYGALHPEIQRIAFEEQNLQMQIRAEINRIIANLETEVSIANERVRALSDRLTSLRSNIAANNLAMVRLRELERDAEASRTTYESFLANFKLTSEQEGITEADARVLSRAVVPRSPSSPKTVLNLILGVVLGLGLGFIAALLAENIDNKISAGDEIETLFQVPFLGNVPALSGADKARPVAYLAANPLSAFSEAFRNLRASIMFADLDNTVQTVAITSSEPDEGKTTVSLSLARMSAISGTRTIVIDGDFRRKQLTEAAELSSEVGLIEYLFGEASLEQVVHRDTESNLDVLPLTDKKQPPRDVFGSRAFDALINELKNKYELIVIDTGPILLMAETRVLANKVDQVVVVARWRATNKGVLQQTLNVLNEFRANIGGVLLNRVDMARYRRHGYGMSGSSKYDKYYQTG